MGAAIEIPVQPGGSIQAAVNNAHSGDTIIVQPGEYIGNIDISRGYGDELSNLVLKSASNNPEDTVIIADNSAAAAVKGVITVRYKTNVTVRGFTISGARSNMAGVHLDQSTKCTVENNKFLDDGLGVKVERSTDSVVQNNNIDRVSGVGNGTGINIENSGNTKASQNSVFNQNIGIYVTGSNSQGSLISGNTLNQNNNNGAELERTRGITLDGNTLNLNGITGISLSYSDENTLTNNNVTMIDFTVRGTNTNGINIINSNSNTVSNNYVTKSGHGIFLNTCNRNTVEMNTVPANLYGIAMRYSNNNKVINNNADGNRIGLFFTYDDSGNTISNNHANGCTDAGIHLASFCGPNNLVNNNIVNSNGYNGIYIESHDNNISNNYATGNARGIFLQGSGCYNNKVSNNVVNYSTGNGIRLTNTSRNNKLDGNTIISNSGDGIYLFNSNNSNLENNIVNRNNIGVHLENSSLVTVNNTAAQYNRIGIRLYLSDNSTLSSNTLDSSSESGIDFNSAVNNKAAGNIITLNRKGISMCPRCSGNTIYNNKFVNDENADVNNAANTWYTAKIQMKNVMSGNSTGGNFWGSRSGRDGFSETAIDTDRDGISETQYTSEDGYITDMYPLVAVIVPEVNFNANPTRGYVPLSVQFTDLSKNAVEWKWDFGDGSPLSAEQNPTHTYSTIGTYTVRLTVSNKNDTKLMTKDIIVEEYKVLPVANFNANPTSGTAPLSVQFTDSSQNAAAWNWNFGDGATSPEQNPTHTYPAAGTYNVNLLVSNANGTSPQAATATITVQSLDNSNNGGGGGGHISSGSSGSSGGGGGAGGSPEPQSNVEVKELSQTFVTSGKSVKFEFPRNATSIASLSFDSKKTAGKTTTIVESLKGKSTLVTGLPSDEVYKYLNIWVGNSGFATPSNIENSVISFKVEKSWIQDKKIDKSSITLNRYSDKKWNQLPASLSGEDNKYLYFKAKTPGFSPFAITGKSTATVTAVQPATGNKTQLAVNNTQTKPTNEKKDNTSTPTKESKSTPGFELVFGITGLLTVFLCRRKTK